MLKLEGKSLNINRILHSFKYISSNSNFRLENPVRHHLNQMIEVNATSNIYQYYVFPEWMHENGSSPL